MWISVTMWISVFSSCLCIRLPYYVLIIMSAGCKEDTLRETLREYKEAAERGRCARTGKMHFPVSVDENDVGLVLARITPVIHYCMGMYIL